MAKSYSVRAHMNIVVVAEDELDAMRKALDRAGWRFEVRRTQDTQQAMFDAVRLLADEAYESPEEIADLIVKRRNEARQPAPENAPQEETGE